MDEYLEKELKKYFFGKQNLYNFYKTGKFNYHCQLGSLMCIINLGIKSKLIRGELLYDGRNNIFIHGWIEADYNGKEYVIDTSMAKAIPKKICRSKL